MAHSRSSHSENGEHPQFASRRRAHSKTKWKPYVCSLIVAVVAGGGWYLWHSFSRPMSPEAKDIEEASALIQEGRQEEAIPQLEKWLLTAGDDELRFRLHSLLGVALHRANRYPEAIEQFMHAAKLNATGYPLHLNLNESFRAMGLNALSTASLRTALELDPDNMLVNIKWRIRLIETGNANLVQNELKQLTQEEKRTPDVTLVSAAIELQKGNSAESTRLMQIAKAEISQELYQAIVSEPVFASLFSRSSLKVE